MGYYFSSNLIYHVLVFSFPLFLGFVYFYRFLLFKLLAIFLYGGDGGGRGVGCGTAGYERKCFCFSGA